MASRVCLIDLPGLSKKLLSAVPAESAFGKWVAGKTAVTLKPSWPAVTCSVQATLTTGVPPSQHGIVANGIPTFRSVADRQLVDDSNFAEYRKQVSFWEQSNQFVQVPRFWQNADGTSRYKTALLFFQNSMPGFHGTPRPAADIVLTPKPDHGPDGKLVSLCWSNPPELVPALFKELGPFPLMNYWGPMAGIASSKWIAKAAAMVWQQHAPQVQLVYIPHLDYDLQRFGPDSPQAIRAVVDLASALEPLFASVIADGADVVVLSEYSISTADDAIALNKLFRHAGLLVTRDTPDGVLIDYEMSDAFAMVDHQIAHVYLKNDSVLSSVDTLLRKESIVPLTADRKVTHPRAGDIQVEAPGNKWFDYRWWDLKEVGPGFASTVDIHRKPGYDPLELFFDPATKSVISDSNRIRGSHGRSATSDGLCLGLATQAESLNAADVANELAQLLSR